jgi:hypothetical protein
MNRPEWIETSKQLPEESALCVVWIDEDYEFARYSTKERGPDQPWFVFDFSVAPNWEPLGAIKYWHPLPPYPPKP